MALDQEFSGTFSSLVPPGGRTPTTTTPTATPHGLGTHLRYFWYYLVLLDAACYGSVTMHTLWERMGVLQFVSNGILFLVLI